MGRCRWQGQRPMALEESMTLPPPTARMKSIFSARHSAGPHDERTAWDWLHAAQFDPAEAGRFQRCGHLVKQAGFFDRAAAVVDEDARRAVFLQDRADLRFDVAAKNDLGGCAVNKVVHDTLLRHNVIASIIA